MHLCMHRHLYIPTGHTHTPRKVICFNVNLQKANESHMQVALRKYLSVVIVPPFFTVIMIMALH